MAENIGFGLKLQKWSKKKIEEQVEKLLALVHMEGLGDRTIDRIGVNRPCSGQPEYQQSEFKVTKKLDRRLIFRTVFSHSEFFSSPRISHFPILFIKYINHINMLYG